MRDNKFPRYINFSILDDLDAKETDSAQELA